MRKCCSANWPPSSVRAESVACKPLSGASPLPHLIAFRPWNMADCGRGLAPDESNSVSLKAYFFFFSLAGAKPNNCPFGQVLGKTETSYKALRLSLGHSVSSLRTPLHTQRSGVAARISSDAKASSCPFSWRFFVVYCAALWRLCAGYLRVCRCSGESVREPAYSCHPHRVAAINGSSFNISGVSP